MSAIKGGKKRELTKLESRREDYEKTVSEAVKYQHVDEEKFRKAFIKPGSNK